MAKLKAHGYEVGTIYGLTGAKRYMSDGQVLKNLGFGWKLYSKCKPEVTPEQAFKNAQVRLEAFMDQRPLWAAYRKELHAMAGLCKRAKLHLAVSLMPDDPDGVWSEACDGYGDNVHASIDEVSNLCTYYKLALKESAELKQPLAA